MMTGHKNSDFRLLFLIATQKLTQKAEELCSEKQIGIVYHVYGKGTASGEIADMFGVGSIDKSVLITMLPKTFADKMLQKFQYRLNLGTKNSGVAFTLPLSGSSASMVHALKALEQDGKEKKQEKTGGGSMDNQYTVIMAFVNQGFSEEVMAAARPVGATGGTVFHSRQIGNEEALKFLGVTIQQEREIVLILAEKENKLAIMRAIGERCGVNTAAQGMVVSMPVDGVAGLYKDI